MSPALLSTQQVADRMGLTTRQLQDLRLRGIGPPIVQRGLSIHYEMADVMEIERHEAMAILEQVLVSGRPLTLLRTMAEQGGFKLSPILQQVSVPTSLAGRPTLQPETPAPTPEPPAVIPPRLSVISSREPATLSTESPALSIESWYLVHTKAHQENTAITNLQRQNFRCYMPMLYVEKVRRGKPVVVAEPMFPSYVFVQLDTSDNIKGQSWSPIRSTLGVRDLVKFGGHPAKVDADLITALHEREQLQQSNPQALFAAGDKVVITDGPFAGIEAIYQTADAEQRSMILLSMLNKPVAMLIEPGKLRKCG
jgi:transcription elongation factor/antiterminator RfaH